jgi:hypothetical protein
VAVASRQSAGEVPEDLRRLASAFADDAKAFADALTEAIYAEIPELGAGGDEQAKEELRRSAEANIELAFRMLAEGRAAQPADTPQQALDHARSLVRRGASLAVVLRAYRLGHALAWERLAEAIVEAVAPADQPPLLARSSRHLFGYIDAICDRIVDEHEAERASWARWQPTTT